MELTIISAPSVVDQTTTSARLATNESAYVARDPVSSLLGTGYRFVGFTGTTHPKSLSGRRHLMSAPLPWWQVVIDSIHNRPIPPRSIPGGGSGPLASSERTQPRFQADARRMHHTSFSTGMGPVRVQYQPADADAAAVQRLTAPRGALSVARDRLSGVRPAKARGPASPRPAAHGTTRPAAPAVPPPTPPAPPPRECSDDGVVVIHPHPPSTHAERELARADTPPARRPPPQPPGVVSQAPPARLQSDSGACSSRSFTGERDERGERDDRRDRSAKSSFAQSKTNANPETARRPRICLR